MHHQVRQCIIDLHKGGDLATHAAYQLREKADLSDQIEALGQLSLDEQRLENLLVGKCFATDWRDVWRVTGPPPIKNSQKAINWFTATFSHYRVSLQKHTEAALRIRHAVLQGRLENARELLSQHQQNFGPTIWCLSWLFVIAEESGGSQVRQELLERLRGPEFGKNILGFGGFYNLATDQTLPEEHYRTAVRSRFPTDRAFRQFLELLILEDYSDKWDAWEALHYAEHLPLVDRYEFFLRIAAIALAAKNEDAKKFARVLGRISKLCDDFNLQYLANCSEERTPAKPIGATEAVLSAWDAYMSSRYEECHQLAEEIVSRYPELITAHELGIKSAMYLGRANQFDATTTPLGSLRHH